MSFAKDFLMGIGPIPGLPGPGTFLQSRKVKRQEKKIKKLQSTQTQAVQDARNAALFTGPAVERSRFLGQSALGGE